MRRILNLLMGRNKQKCLYFGEDRVIDEITRPIDKGYVYDKKKGEKWHLIHELLMPVQGKKRLFLLLSPRDSIPIDALGALQSKDRKKLTTNISHIARRSLHSELTKIERDSYNNQIAQSIRFVTIMAGIIVCVLAILAMMGKVSF